METSHKSGDFDFFLESFFRARESLGRQWPTREQIYRETERLSSTIDTIVRRTEEISEDARNIRQEVHENFVIDTMGIDHATVAQKRYAPVRVYISEDNPELVAIVERAVTEYSEKLGFVSATEYPAEKGSWYKRWIAKSKDALTSEQAQDAFKKGKRALELALVDKKRAEINRDNAQAASDFIKAVENVPDVVAQFGSLLIVKNTNPEGKCMVITRVLCEKEMEFIESNQDIMKDSENILDRLTKIGDQSHTPSQML
jgi:hypothetical protein